MSTQLVGILNLTPDSFSDGARYCRVDAMIAALEGMRDAGAVAVDVGAESTRPGAVAVTPQQEWERLEPFFAEAWPRFHDSGLRLSVDTRHAQTARRAARQGAHWINDVSGFAAADMLEAARGSDCTLVVMHSLTVPADPAITIPAEADVIAVLAQFAHERINTLAGYGIGHARIIFDPGIGFGKTAAQSLEIIRRAEELTGLGVPLLIGHSRKSFMKPFGERDAATLAFSRHLAGAGVQYLRVHDVPAHAAMLKALA